MTHSTKPHSNRTTTAHAIAKVLQRKFSVKLKTTQWRRRHLMVAAGRPPPDLALTPAGPDTQARTRATRLPSLFPLVLASVAGCAGVRRKDLHHRGRSSTMPTRSHLASPSRSAAALPETSHNAWWPQESPGRRLHAGLQCALEDMADTAERRRGKRRAAS